MRTCSSLTRNCAYVTKLSKARPRSAYVQATAAEGTRFGALVQEWVDGGNPQPPEVLDEPWCWFENMRAQWKPPRGAVCEVALGISPAGEYVPVHEPEPHVYRPIHEGAILATAGRLDVAWINGNVAVVLDNKRNSWKYGAPEACPQLMALGTMWAKKHGLSWMQLGLYSAKDAVFTWSPEIQLVAAVVPEVLEMTSLPEDRPIVGDWCVSCYEKKGCKEGTKYLNDKR